MSATGHKRVYESKGFYFFVDRDRKWHKLCRIADGEAAMLRALAKMKDAPESRPGSMLALIKDWRTKVLPKYAASTQYDYGLMLDKIAVAMRDLDVAEIDASHVLALRRQWRDKPRTANKYRAMVSILMSYAVEEEQRTTNPVINVKTLEEPTRTRYLGHDELIAIIKGATFGDDGRKNASGQMIVAMIEFAYLTALRMGDIRKLTWGQINDEEGIIRVTPTKTKKNTGATIKIPITAEMQAILDRAKALGTVKGLTVFHNLKGQPYSKSGVETAWERACRRAKVEDANFHDLRAKALTDADEAGVSLKALQAAAAHASLTTTERYLRGRKAKISALGLTVPKPKKTA